MPAFKSLNNNGIRFQILATDADRETAEVEDAGLHFAVTGKDEVGRVTAASINVVTVPDHDLVVGEFVVVDQAYGDYAMNGMREVLAVAGDDVTLDYASTGTLDVSEIEPYVYRCVEGLEDVVPVHQADGWYYLEQPGQVKLVRGGQYLVFAWDEGPYAAEYFEKFSLTGS